MKTVVLFFLAASVFTLIYGCAGALREAAGRPPDDAGITRTIREEIASDPELRQQRITVVSRNGEVVLSGRVQSRKQESRIIRFALRVKGVRSVKDDIAVLKK